MKIGNRTKTLIKKTVNDGKDIALNSGRMTADTALSAVGADNVIQSDDYTGYGAKNFAKTSNITGGITKAIVPIAAGAIGFAMGGPTGAQMGLMAGKAGQSIGGSFNQQQEFSEDEDINNSMMLGNKIGNGVSGVTNAASPFLNMLPEGRNGGMYNMYPNGGINMAPNAELELSENTLNPDGTTDQYEGRSHENGGIPTRLDPGTMIFSDKLKLPGTKKTFADLNKENNTDKETKMLDNIKANKLQKATAELMMQAKHKKSLVLFESQEQFKQEKLNNYSKRLGINTDTKQFPNGGRMSPGDWDMQNQKAGYMLHPTLGNTQSNDQYKSYYDPNKFQPQYNQEGKIKWNKIGDPTYNFQTGVEKPVIQYSRPGTNVPGNTYMNDIANNRQVHSNGGIQRFANGGPYGHDQNDEMLAYLTKDNTQRGNASIDRNNFNMYTPEDQALLNSNDATTNKTDYSPYINAAKQIGLGFAQNAGNLYDLKNSNKAVVEQYNRVKPELIDPSAALKYNDLQLKSGYEALRNSTNGNSSTYIQNRKDLAINGMLTNARIRQDASNQNANILNQAAYYNAGTGDKETIANIQNQANVRNIRGDAYNNIGTNVKSQYMDNERTKQDSELLNILTAQYPEMLKNPAMADYIAKHSKKTTSRKK